MDLIKIADKLAQYPLALISREGLSNDKGGVFYNEFCSMAQKIWSRECQCTKYLKKDGKLNSRGEIYQCHLGLVSLVVPICQEEGIFLSSGRYRGALANKILLQKAGEKAEYPQLYQKLMNLKEFTSQDLDLMDTMRLLSGNFVSGKEQADFQSKLLLLTGSLQFFLHHRIEFLNGEHSKLLATFLDVAQTVSGCAGYALYLFESGDGVLKRVLVRGISAEKLTIRLLPGQGFGGWVLREKLPLIVDDIFYDPRLFLSQNDLTPSDVKSLAAFPVMRDQETVYGVIYFFSRPEHSFPEHVIEYLELLTKLIEAAITFTEESYQRILAEKKISAMGELIRLCSTEITNSKFYDLFFDLLWAMLGPEQGLLYFSDGNRLNLHFSRGLTEQDKKKYAIFNEQNKKSGFWSTFSFPCLENPQGVLAIKAQKSRIDQYKDFLRFAIAAGTLFWQKINITTGFLQNRAVFQEAKNAMGNLTERESEVLEALTLGLNNKEIGKYLKISEKTVKTHVTNILAKLQVNDRTKAVVLALNLGLVSNSKGY